MDARDRIIGRVVRREVNGPGDHSVVDPMLASLSDNGGPTRTHLPMADQRLGTNVRVRDGRVDVRGVDVRVGTLPPKGKSVGSSGGRDRHDH